MEHGIVRENGKLKVRCPSCFKLYAVSTAEIAEPRPRFECIGCTTRFWISYPDALQEAGGVIGFPLEWLSNEKAPVDKAPAKSMDIEVKAFQCPKCTEPYAGGAKECTGCGLLFEKFVEPKNQKRYAPEASRDVKDQWDRVVQSYDNWAEHESFIQMSQAEMSLEFAEYSYSDILRVNPADEMALKATEQIYILKSVIDHSVNGKPVKDHFNFGLPRLRLGTMVMMMSVIVIVIGFAVPGMRNLIGFGCSVLFAFMALRYYFRAL